MLRVAQRRVVEEGADGSQPGVAGAGAVVALLLEMVKEGADGGGIQVGQVEFEGLLAGPVAHEAQQQAPGIPVGGNGVRAGVALADQPVRKIRLQGRRERAHGLAPCARSRRPAASASSSGTADKYQYVEEGLPWPR